MDKFRGAIIQLVAIGVIAGAVAFTHNAFSVNGINPFRRIADVPVMDDAEPTGGPVGENAEPTEGIRFISLEETREMIERGAPLIDARTHDEYVEGHIPGALLLDYYDMGRYLDAVLRELPADAEIAIYCNGRWCEDSELLARELFMNGYKKLFVFQGGYEEWLEAGLPVERGTQGVRVDD